VIRVPSIELIIVSFTTFAEAMSNPVDTITVRTSNLKFTPDASQSKNTLPLSYVDCQRLATVSHIQFAARRHEGIQLPLEILRKVFTFLVDLHCAQKNSHLCGPPAPGWIAITYVCQYWRSAALGLPELWSSIMMGFSFSWAQAMVERSSPLPMQIDMALRPFFEDGLEALAASEVLPVSRIRTLHLSGHSDDIHLVLKPLCNPSMLESLSLWIPSARDELDLTKALSDRDVPLLHHLTFESPRHIYALHKLPLWLLAGITHFTTSAWNSLDAFYDALQAMPQLEVLCTMNFSKIFYNNVLGDGVVRRRVKVPRLSLLSFHESHPAICVIISTCIDGPPTLRRHIFWEVDDPSPWFKRGWTLKAIKAFIPNDSALDAHDGGLRAVQIGGYKSGPFEVWSRTFSGYASTSSREDALFLLSVDWSHLDSDLVDFLIPSLFFNSATSIEELIVNPSETTGSESAVVADRQDSVFGRLFAEDWRTLLEELPSVKTLRLYGGNHQCASALRALSGLSSSQDLILPRLQRIIVVDSATPAYPDGLGFAGPGADCSEVVQVNVGTQLVEAVSGRSGLEVVLAGCEVDEETLEALQKRARVYIGHERVYG
jgi:hypothetical protein